MSELQWKDDGFFIHVQDRDMVTGEFYWRRAELADCRVIILATQEASAKVADAHVAQHEGRNDYPPGVRAALQLEGRSIAEGIRSIKIETGHE